MQRNKYHQVSLGQTLSGIAAAYHVGEYALAKENCLGEEVSVGQILRLPQETGNRYVVGACEDKKLLCGSVEQYEKKNGKALYPGQRIVL